jgi:hypothetical protein
MNTTFPSAVRFRNGSNGRRLLLMLLPGLLLLAGRVQSASPVEQTKTESPPADAGAAKPSEVSADAAVEVPWLLQPYRVRVVLEIMPSPDWPPAACQALQAKLQAELTRYLGELWQAEVRLGDDPHPLPTTWWKNRLPEFRRTTFDKVFLLRLVATGGGYRLQGQEWDQPMDDLGPLQTIDLYDRRELGHQCVSMIQRTFRAVGHLDSRRDGSVRIATRGGELKPPDPTWNPLRPNVAWEVCCRYLSPQQTLLRVERIPWTYVLPKSDDRGQAECEVISGFRSPLNVRRRGMELVAIAVRPLYRQTTIRIRTRGSQRPAAGYAVEWQVDPKQAVLRELTDRQGTITIPAPTASRVPLLLQIRNGQMKLASLPLIPGVHAVETAELPDDDPRLQAEGQISLLQTELIDIVAQRAVLASRARQEAQAGHWDAVEELLSQQKQLRSQASFTSDLNAIRVTAVRVAKASRNLLTERRISRLCDETAELITRYLGPEKLRLLRDELQELRQAAEE